ncbi:winged helix-turn-helix domain-containing protein [Tenacibaculum tangerinum]|uniref:Winged helix-turn-helix domain-containing protein n=1 Tax=Tenacibaculum tangerinum TaxID=3038772 RepID=A0ABY8L5B2_9FLAO|nr:winged helix-turn-helix domain-containing protein [Tenacibaculum tangerinum]WGH75110.1 winged helix-turn-helix domain-containing protein [Tenacibaculum tangerinum]
MSKKCKRNVNSCLKPLKSGIFVNNMNTYSNFITVKIGLYLFAVIVLFTSCTTHENFSERAKVSLRNIGHQLLLSNQDTTSLVLPIQQINEASFQLSFQNNLEIQPDSLVTLVHKNFEKAGFPADYILEVKNCTDEEVVYSYEMQKTEEKAIIPCKGRTLPKNCYFINIQFLKEDTSNNRQLIFYGVLFLAIIMGVVMYQKNRKSNTTTTNNLTNVVSLGIFEFYPEQHKLVKQALEISLSKKECELLEILISRPNEIIKREELTKRVWEDNGVIVGRSLDTYISKLRKKLKDDTSIKITNIHGVGYKLEID